MKRVFLLSASLMTIFLTDTLCNAVDTSLLYVKPGDLPPQHVIVDENVKCVECHPLKTKGIDAYTSATMTLKKSSLGVMPKEALEKRIIEVLSGQHGREIFVLATSYDNKPLATVIEFSIDPQTLDLYSMSERQGEKLFQINKNEQVSLAYVKQVENYFRQALGVQIVGRAKLLTGEDPEYQKGLDVYLPSLLHMLPKPPTDPESLKAFREQISKTKIMTKVTPERMVLRDVSLKARNYRIIQLWEK